MAEKTTEFRASTYFTLYVGAAFFLAGLLAIAYINREERINHLEQADRIAQILLDRNLATHAYFTKNLKPAVFRISGETRSKDYFDPAWMSSTYAIRRIDAYFKALGLKEYYYKECSVNARSPENEADPIEKAFLEELARNPALTVRSEVRMLDGKPYYVVMKRGETFEESCLRCHDRAENAPGDLVRMYGNLRGFDREPGTVAQAISLRIPLAAAYKDANRHSLRLSLILGGLFLFLFGAQYLIGRRLVFSPIEAVRDKAHQIAGDESHLGDRIEVSRGREIRELADAFNGVSVRLRREMDSLEEHVRERTKEIEDINETLHADVEKRRKVETELTRSEARLRAIFEGASIGFALVDRDGRLLETNQVLENFLGYSKEELRGMPFMDVTYPDDVEPDWSMYQEIWKGTRERYQLEKRYLRKDGSVAWGRKVVSVVKGRESEYPYAINMIEDITERKRYEEEALKARKLESLGVLAGGIAHDFNNYLTSILGNISLLRMRAAATDGDAEILAEAEKAAMRAKSLSQQLITFSTGGAPVRKSASLNELIEDSAMFALRGSRAKCVFSLPEDLWSAEIDEGQISQVLAHIVLNADQAMPGGGTIAVEAENLRVGKDSLQGLKPGGYVRIRVKDQGEGIPQENLSRIFDPYFTTKSGRSGLGLTAARSIVLKHEGSLTVDSEPGNGAVFTILLPATGAGGPEAAPRGDLLAGRGGKVLVMDDEEMVRNVSREMLKALGYEVETAGDGNEAISLYRRAMEAGNPFDAVLMDLTVPGGMGGEEAIRKLLEIDPGVRAVVSSGYSDDPVMANHGKYGFRGVMTKPYRVSDLAATMKRALGPAGDAAEPIRPGERERRDKS